MKSYASVWKAFESVWKAYEKRMKSIWKRIKAYKSIEKHRKVYMTLLENIKAYESIWKHVKPSKVYKSIQGLFWSSFSHQRFLKMPKNWVSYLSFEVFSLCFEGFSCVFSYFHEFKVLLPCFLVATVGKFVSYNLS